MKRLATVLATVALAISPAAAGDSESRKVDVAGNTYRVFIRHGKEVKVFNKSAITGIRMGRSTERRDQMREAVRLATGCKFVDDEWIENHRVGNLDCSATQSAAP